MISTDLERATTIVLWENGNVHWTLNTMPNMVTNHPPVFSHFFLIFSLYHQYFFFSIATLSIFGNVHWTLNTMPNMVTNHPLFFLHFF